MTAEQLEALMGKQEIEDVFGYSVYREELRNLSPSLALRVIAAEKLVRAANVARTALAGYSSIDHAIRELDEAIPAYREASK